MKVDQNKLTILKALIAHVESGKKESTFMEIFPRDTHLMTAARSMPDAVVVIHRDGRIFLAEKERYMREGRHA